MLALGFLLVVLAFILSREIKKNKALARTVDELEQKVTKPFGLKRLESVGSLLGGLTAEIVRATYAAAQVDDRPNTVSEDLADAETRSSIEIDRADATIRTLRERIVAEQQNLAAHYGRTGALAAIGKLLPKEQ